MEIYPLKLKAMTYKGQDPIRCKIITDNTIVEQVNTFTYLGCKISYKEKKDIFEVFTNYGNSEQCFETTFSPKTILTEST
jgi:hypothetical protein